MTPRLTAPQITVLMALDALPEGEWITAKDGGFSGRAAGWLVYSAPRQLAFRSAYRLQTPEYMIAPAGRALVARLKAEGAI